MSEARTGPFWASQGHIRTGGDGGKLDQARPLVWHPLEKLRFRNPKRGYIIFMNGFHYGIHKTL